MSYYDIWLTYFDMVEVVVSSLSLLVPTKYLESPSLTIGAFFVREIWAVAEI